MKHFNDIIYHPGILFKLIHCIDLTGIGLEQGGLMELGTLVSGNGWIDQM